MAKAKSPIPEDQHTVTPQLVLDNAAEAMDATRKAWGRRNWVARSGLMERSCTPSCASATHASWSTTR